MKTLKSSRNVKILAIAALSVCAIATYFGARSLNQIQTQYSVMQFLPSHHPALIMDEAVRSRFHLTNLPVYIGVITLDHHDTWFKSEHMQRLSQLTAEIAALSSVKETLSLGNVEGALDSKGSINVGEVVKLTPPNQWRQRILNDKLLSPTLISHDQRTALIYVQLKNADMQLLLETQPLLKRMLAKTFPQAKTSIGGIPAVQSDLSRLLNKELVNFFTLSIIGCALTLLLIFRTWSTLFIPLILTAFANIMVLAMMAWTGLPFTILSSTLPILVFITVLSLSTHVLLRVYEDAHKTPAPTSKWQLIWHANQAILLPNLLGALTTCVGFLTLLLGEVPLIRNYGMSVAAGVMVSWFLTNVAILPLLVLFPLPEPRAWVHRPARWALWVIQQRKLIVGGIATTCVALLTIGWHLHWTGRLFDDLPKGQEARTSTERIDHSMGGVVPLEITIRAPGREAWNDPERIRRLDRLVAQIRTIKGVGTAQSIPDFLRTSGAGTDGLTPLPKSRSAIAEIYFLYSLSSHNPLRNYLTDDGRSARISVKLHDLPANYAQSLVDHLRERTHVEFPESRTQIGGLGATVHLIHYELSKDLIFGFWQAMFIIVILLAVIFRSLRWALVACIPNLVPPIALLGYLALTQTPIKPGVAIIFSIALGLAFNNTVYLMNRMRSLMRKGQALPVTKTFYLEGNPCLVSTLIVMVGFSVFMFSYFSLNQTFGACMVVSIFAGIIGDLVLLPALLKMYPFLLGGNTSPVPVITSEISKNSMGDAPATAA
jgi:predicted RND superfamily exporter protein